MSKPIDRKARPLPCSVVGITRPSAIEKTSAPGTGWPPRMGAWAAMYSLLVNSSSEKPQSVTKFKRSASNSVRPKVTNVSPTLRSRQFQPSPSCFIGLVGMFVGMGALAQHVESAAVGAFDPPVLAQTEVDFGMPQRAATAVTGDAV